MTKLSLYALGAISFSFGTPLATALTNSEAADLVASKYDAPTNGWCLDAARRHPDKFQINNSFSSNADSVRVCYEYW